MRVRGSGKAGEKIEPQMAPMIDVVFQLLIFFMLTLKIIEPEGDFSINMPIGAPSPTQDPKEDIVPFTLTMKARADGSLESMALGKAQINIPAAASEDVRRRVEKAAFEDLNNRLGTFIERDKGKKKQIEVTIKADHHLKFGYTVNAIGAVRGKMAKTVDGQLKLKSYVENIKFAPPQRPKSGT